MFRIGGREYGCPLHLSLAVLTGKWKGLVIWFLYEAKTLRYGENKDAAQAGSAWQCAKWLGHFARGRLSTA